MLETKDIFLQFFQDIKNGDNIEDICKKYGGSNMYIPSFKSMGRNDEILKEFKARCSLGESRSSVIRDLSFKYTLATTTIYNIINQISLFDE